MFQSLDEGIVVFKNNSINFQNEVSESIFKLDSDEEVKTDILDLKIFK